MVFSTSGGNTSVVQPASSSVCCNNSDVADDNSSGVIFVSRTTSMRTVAKAMMLPDMKPLADSDRVTSNNTAGASSSDNDNDSSTPTTNSSSLHMSGKQPLASPTTGTATTVNANSASFTVADGESAAAATNPASASFGITGSSSSSNRNLVNSNNNNSDVVIMPDEFSRKLVAQVNRRLDSFLAKSPHIRTNTALPTLPRFTRSHLNLGKTLAKGGFSNIIEVNSFNTEECILRPASSVDDDSDYPYPQQQRHHNSSNCLKCCTPPSTGEYVVKCLSTRLGLKKLPGATKDIVFEAHTLASLQHENIVQIRGWSQDGIYGFQTTKRADGFFIILDKLGDTLFQRVFQWQAELKGRGKYSHMKITNGGIGGGSGSSSSKSSSNGKKKQQQQKISYQKIVKQQFQEKIQICVDVASALAYCHERRICHRDIKSANVAFDPLRPNRAKLIDFGLATELPPRQPGESAHKVYEMTGNIGTARYMAPELILEKPYNEKADVHSFAVLCWEACAAKKPYSSLDAKAVKEHVSRWNERPKAYWSWPRKLRRILKQGWARDQKDRPTMEEFRNALLKVQAALPKSNIDFGTTEKELQL